MRSPRICMNPESNFQEPRIRAAWVTGLACLCPISQQSRETLLTPPGRRPKARKGPRETFEGDQHKAGSWPWVKEFPQGSAFQNVFPRQGCFRDAFEEGTEKRKLEGWNTTSLTLPQFNQRPWGHLRGNRLLIGYFPCQGDPKDSPMVEY